jgi:hypothetical protein
MAFEWCHRYQLFLRLNGLPSNATEEQIEAKVGNEPRAFHWFIVDMKEKYVEADGCTFDGWVIHQGDFDKFIEATVDGKTYKPVCDHIGICK